MKLLSLLLKRVALICTLTIVSANAFAEELTEVMTDGENQEEVTPARVEKISKNCYVNLDYYDKYPSYERIVDRQNHLNSWSKFCNIYGIISAVVGGLDLGLGISEGDEYATALGAICAAQGVACAIIGANLRAKRNAAREEINRINTVGFPTSEIIVKDKKLIPCVDLLTDNSTHKTSVGVGIRFEF